MNSSQNINKTAWYNEKDLPVDMVDSVLSLKPGWSKLEDTEHFINLKNLIMSCSAITVADIGCGSAELGRVLKSQFLYTGFDLPHIIKNVSKKLNPDLKYIDFDAYGFDYTNLQNFDLIICNSFISELSQPLIVLENLFKNFKTFLIIHRQHFATKESFTMYKTYGNLSTTRYYISSLLFKNLLSTYNIDCIKYIHNDQIGDSLLLFKN